MWLLTNPKIRKKGKKIATKTVKSVAVITGIGLGGYLLYSMFKNPTPEAGPDIQGTYEMSPETTTTPEVEYIANQIFNDRTNAIEEARQQLLTKMELQNQQKIQIETLQQKVTELEGLIAYNKEHYVNFLYENLETDEKNIEYYRKRVEDNTNLYNDYFNKWKNKQAELANAELTLDSIYKRNEWWNPGWYIEKGNQERLVQTLKSEFEVLALQKNSAESGLAESNIELEKVRSIKAKRLEEINKNTDRYVKPYEAELVAAKQTLAMYQVAYDAIATEIARLEAIVNGA